MEGKKLIAESERRKLQEWKDGMDVVSLRSNGS